MFFPLFLLAWEVSGLWAYDLPYSTCSVCIDYETRRLLALYDDAALFRLRYNASQPPCNTLAGIKNIEYSNYGCVRVKLRGGPHIPENMTYVMHARMEAVLTGYDQRDFRQTSIEKGFQKDTTPDKTLFIFEYCNYMTESCFTQKQFLSPVPVPPPPPPKGIPTIKIALAVVLAILSFMACLVCRLCKDQYSQIRYLQSFQEYSRQDQAETNLPDAASNVQEPVNTADQPNPETAPTEAILIDCNEPCHSRLENEQSGWETEIAENTQNGTTSHVDYHIPSTDVFHDDYYHNCLCEESTNETGPTEEVDDSVDRSNSSSSLERLV